MNVRKVYIVVILCMIVIAAGAFWRQRQEAAKLRSEKEGLRQIADQHEKSVAENEKNGTVGWKRAVSERHGFEFRYPSNWYIQSETPDVIFLSEQNPGEFMHFGFQIKVLEKYAGMNLSEIFDGSNEPKIDFTADCVQKIFSGIDSYYCSPKESISGVQSIIFRYNNVVYNINDYYIDDTTSAMLMSFKFIK